MASWDTAKVESRKGHLFPETSHIKMILGLVTVSLIARWLWKGFRGPLSHVPGPWHSRFMPLVWIGYCVIGRQPEYASWLFERYGSVVRAAPSWVLLSDKDMVRRVLVEEDLPKSPLYELSRKGRMSSLISERDTAIYKKRRRLISHGFSVSYLKGLEPLMQACVKDALDVIDSQIKRSSDEWATIDVYNLFSNLTSDIIAATSFGGSMNAVKNNNDYMKKLIVKRIRRSIMRIMVPFLAWIEYGPLARDLTLDEICIGVVAQRRKELKAGQTDRKDLLQMLLDAQDSDPVTFSEPQIVEEMILFMLAGSDTSSTTAFFALLNLLKHPEKLARLEQELLVHDSSTSFTFDETNKMDYLNAVIHETLRLHTITVGGMPRHTQEPIIMGHYSIPPKVDIVVFVDKLATDPTIWPAAKSFIPERWLDGYEDRAPDRKAYLPFSGGIRSCVGKEFAWKEIRLILAGLISRYEMQMIPGQSEKTRFHAVPYLTALKYDIKVRRRK